MPGVSPTNVGGGTQLFPETSAVPGVGLSVEQSAQPVEQLHRRRPVGQRRRGGLSGIAYGVDAVEQFQVITSGGQAELGRALGGQINVTTRSGTNVWRVDGYGFFRDDRFNARQPVARGEPVPQSRSRAEQQAADAPEPIRRERRWSDRLATARWYFGNLERPSSQSDGLVTIGAADPAVVDQINAKLSDGRLWRSAGGRPGSTRIRSTRLTGSPRSTTSSGRDAGVDALQPLRGDQRECARRRRPRSRLPHPRASTISIRRWR